MPRSSPRKTRAVNYTEDENSGSNARTNDVTGPAVKAKEASSMAAPKRKADSASAVTAETGPLPAATKKRRTKVTGIHSVPPAERTAISSLKKSMYIGAHVSAAGGVQNSINNAIQIGANSFALFLKSQRKWNNPPMAHDAKIQFLNQCREHNYNAAKYALPHGSYLVNLAQADKEKASQAYESFIDDLRRCEQLGIKLYNFHPGSTGGDTKLAAIVRIAAQLNKAHQDTNTVITVLENMAGSGNVVGSTWEDLRDIIALIDDKSRIGVCIDTCHAFAAGYDLRTPEAFEATIDSFNDIVGIKYLKAFHLNDSKAPFNSNRDLHANIGAGFLGLRAFHNIMNHESFQNMPMILETPIDQKGPDGKATEDKQIWAEEIKLLESLIDMDAEAEEFRELEEELQARGADDRKKIQDQVDKKTQKLVKRGK